MIKDKLNPQHNLRRRSLAELDDVIDEIMDRNPEFVEKLTKMIEEKRTENERKNFYNKTRT